MTLKSPAKFEEKPTSLEHFKVSKLVLLWDPFVQSRKSMS